MPVALGFLVQYILQRHRQRRPSPPDFWSDIEVLCILLLLSSGAGRLGQDCVFCLFTAIHVHCVHKRAIRTLKPPMVMNKMCLCVCCPEVFHFIFVILSVIEQTT